MGLLDQALGNIIGGGGNASPMQGVLMGLLGGGMGQGQGLQGGALQGGGMTGAGMTGGGMMGGGLANLIAQFQQAGLGHVAQSWVNNGPNQPVSPQQLQSVFGENQVQTMANQAGMPQQDFLSQLSQHLPNVVNGMTPNGKLPDENTVSV